MTHEAQIALNAVKIRKTCGPFAARQYVINHGGCLGAYRLACQLSACKEIQE